VSQWWCESWDAALHDANLTVIYMLHTTAELDTMLLKIDKLPFA